jgi:hypothetical protein
VKRKSYYSLLSKLLRNSIFESPVARYYHIASFFPGAWTNDRDRESQENPTCPLSATNLRAGITLQRCSGQWSVYHHVITFSALCLQYKEGAGPRYSVAELCQPSASPSVQSSVFRTSSPGSIPFSLKVNIKDNGH